MRKLFTKLFFATFPLLTIIAIYVYNDPFKVIYHYDHFYDADHEIEGGVNCITLNRDYVSTELFLNNYDKYNYDSYIFGNSRSGFYQVAEWQKHINSTRCFHYDAYNECLYGLEKKFEFLHARGVKIKNALIVIDYDVLAETKNLSWILYRKHPALSGESKISFQFSMFRYFLDVNFLTNYIKGLVTGTLGSHADVANTPASGVARYDGVSNEERWWADVEIRMARNSDSVYREKAKIFYEREAGLHYSAHTILQEQIKMLNNIKRIMDGDGTVYQIVINPLYNQKKIDTTDLAILQSIFGKERVHDFSGVNAITRDVHNYYEISHYRTNIATQIMNEIYGSDKQADSVQVNIK